MIHKAIDKIGELNADTVLREQICQRDKALRDDENDSEKMLLPDVGGGFSLQGLFFRKGGARKKPLPGWGEEKNYSVRS